MGIRDKKERKKAFLGRRSRPTTIEDCGLICTTPQRHLRNRKGIGIRSR